MGFPYHFLKPEYRHTWPEVLRQELDGHATVEVIDDLPTDVERYIVPSDLHEVYVAGNHGYFTLGTDHFDERTGVRVFMFPFSTSADHDGQDMVNLEERIHRAFDTMSIALTPESIDRYEKSRWTKFFRLFGWEHVGSQDFAHRRKKEIVEGNSDSDPIRNPFGNWPSVRIKPEYEKTWPDIFRRQLEGLAEVKLITAPPRTIVSPNGKFSIETPTVVRVGSKNAYFDWQSDTEDGICRLDRPSFSASLIRENPIYREAFRVFREVTEVELPTDNIDMEKNAIPNRFYGKTWNLWTLALLFGFVDLSWCVMGPLILCGIIKPLDTYQGNPKHAGLLITMFGLVFLPFVIHVVYHLFIRQWPLIRLYKDGIQLIETGPIAGEDYSKIFTLKTCRRRKAFLRWEEVDTILCGKESLGIIGIESSAFMPIYSFSEKTFAMPIDKVGDVLQYYFCHPETRQSLPNRR